MDDTFLPDEFDKLKDEVTSLKRRQGFDEGDGQLKSSISSLSNSINNLLTIFREASEDLKMDTHDAVLVGQKLDKILDRLDKIEIQNEKIAKGIVAVADMIEDVQANMPSKLKPQSQLRQMQQQPMHMSQMQSQNPTKPLPTYDLPREEEKKKSFLNFKI